MRRRRPLSVVARPLIAAAVVVAIGVLLVATDRPALAYRPFTGTDADVAGTGELELEVGPAGYIRAGDRTAVVAPALIVNWGFAHDFELVLEGLELFPLDPVPGERRAQLLDTQLDVKWVMREGSLQNGAGISLASEWTVLLPETGQPHAGGEVAAIASMRWPSLSVHANGAAAWTRERSLALFGGLIVEGPLAWRVRPVGEAFVDHDTAGATELSGLGGAIWRLGESLTVDGALRLSRTREAGATVRTTEVRAGLTWAFSLT